jgi:hypothetical protein
MKNIYFTSPLFSVISFLAKKLINCLKSKANLKVVLYIVLIMAGNTCLAQVPTITSISPESGSTVPGTLVTITGSNFNTTAANNIVRFGAVTAIVSAATATSLTVTAPLGATYEPITVLNTTTQLMCASPKPFVPTFFPARGDITYQDIMAKVELPNFGNVEVTRSMAIGDLDGDGKDDLVIVNFIARSLSLYRNTSTSGSITLASFDNRVDILTPDLLPQSITIGDIDGDGKADLVVTNENYGWISVFRNTSTIGNIDVNSFAPYVEFYSGPNPISVAISDLDGDGKADLAVANNGSNTVSVLRNTATSGVIDSNSFATWVAFTTGDNPKSIAIGDLDEDGKPDIAVANQGSDTVSVLRNTSSSGSITSASFAIKVDFATGSSPYSVAIGDLDGDGKADLAIANYGPDTVSVLRNTCSSGNISLAAKVDFATGKEPHSVAIGDLDGDGKPDIAVANEYSNTVSVFRNSCSIGSIDSNSFASKVDFATGRRPVTVAIGDMDGDGIPDLVIAGFETSVLRNNPVILPPTITSFTPTSGSTVPGTTVTITGSNFNITAANNIVRFGAVKATVTAATATSLTVTAPLGATYAPITVLNTANGLLGSSPKPFLNTFSPNKGYLIENDILPRVDFENGFYPLSVAIGDLDGDGKPDLAFVNFFGNSISVYRNISNTGTIDSSSFAGKVDFATGSDPISLAIGDVDGDGKPDLLVANSVSKSVSVFRNTSSIGSITTDSFAAKVDFSTGINPYSVAIGDLDEDGKPDVVVANYDSATVSVFHNTSSNGSINSGSFATKVDFSTGIKPYSVAIGDLDGDGKPDIAVANEGSDTVSVLRNTSSNGSITSASFATKVDFATGLSPYAVAIGDLDGDGKPDLAIANNDSASVSVLRNTSSSGSIISTSFAAKVDFAAGAGTRTVAIGDLNGDGKADLALLYDDGVSVLRNSSSMGSMTSGSFADKVNFKTGITNSFSIAIGDLDGDGKPDLAFTDWINQSVSVLRNNPLFPPEIISFTPTSGPVGTSVTITGTNFNTIAANNIVKFGATQATVSAATSTSLTVTVPAGATYEPITVLNKPATLMSAASKPFITTFTPTKNDITYQDIMEKVDFTAVANPISIAIGDLDGDGKSDLAVANKGGTTVSIYRNASGSGSITTSSFAAKVDFTTGASPYSVSIGDFNGDGKADLAVANSGGTTISIFLNTSQSGSISFATKLDFSVGTAPYFIAIGDLDGDGKADLAVANYGSATVSVLRNTSVSNNISFAAKIDFPTTSSNPYSVAIGDLDGDGKPDLAVANNNVSTFSTFRNTSNSGSISFASKVDFAAGGSPSYIAIGDLDGDGKADIAVSNASSQSVSVFRNTSGIGSISVSTKVDFTTGFGPQAVAIGDLDGDGKADLAISNAGGPSVSLLRNKSVSGSISFASRVDFTTGSAPLSVAIGDLDGDGKADLAVANFGAASISVLRNNPILPPTITSFTPTRGPVGTSVTITGTLFNTIAANNIVKFGATNAIVNSATATSLTVTVPFGATYEPITVLNSENYLGGASNKPFVTTFTPNKDDINYHDLMSKVDLATGARPYSVTIGDLDGDGKPDLAIANYDSNTVSVYRNTSSSGSITSASFATKVDFVTGTNPISVAIGDVDGDGKPELVVTNYGSATVSIFRNTSSTGSITSTSFAAKVDFTTGTKPRSVAISDLDGDGKPDLAIANTSDSSVSILRNTLTSGSITNTSFEAKVDFTTGSSPHFVAIGDLDGDGKPDLAFANNGSASVSVLRNASSSGTISFEAKIDFTAGNSPVSVAIGDLDQDGKSDLTVTNFSDAKVSVFRNTSITNTIDANSFAAKVDFTTGVGPWSVAIGDLTGDGKPDLAVSNAGVASVSVLRNIASVNNINVNSFAAKADFATGTATRAIAIGDLDLDGKPDLVAANYAIATISVLRNNPVYSLSYNGNSSTGGTVPVEGYINIETSTTVSTNTGNLVKTGFTFTEWNTLADGSGTTYDASGSASFTIRENTTLYAIWIAIPTPILGDYQPVTLAAAGTNIVVMPNTAPSNALGITAYTTTNFKGTFAVNTTSGDVTITNAYPSGTYTVTVDAGSDVLKTFTLTVGNTLCSSGKFNLSTHSLGSSLLDPISVAVGDFNGDGKQDLVTANNNSNTVTISLGNGDGTFANGTEITGFGSPFSVAVGDFNNDGKQDVVTGNNSRMSVSINLGNGDGTFVAVNEMVLNTDVRDISVGYFNQDNIQDIVITNYASDNLAIGLGIGDGTFTFTTMPSVNSPLFAEIGDFNSDGFQDIIAANNLGSTIMVLTNDGNGAFTSGSGYEIGNNPSAIVTGDFNGDRFPDIAIAHTAATSTISTVSVRFGDGNGGFTGSVDYNVGNSATAITMGDFNGDGFQDFAASSLLDSLVTIYFGNGDGTFANPFVLTVGGASGPGGSSYAITTGNFNGDGYADFVFTYSGGKDLGIALGGAAEVNVLGNATTIVSGDTTPSVTDATDFGDVALNTPTIKTYTIENTGTTSLSISSISSSGTDAGDFVVGDIMLPATIAAGANSTFTLTFTSTTTGAKTATVTINNDDCDDSVYVFAVQGGGNSLNVTDFSNVKWNFYPNPVNDFLNIVIENNGMIKGYEIYDVSGKCIDFNTNYSSNNIKVYGFSRGIYFLKVHTDTGLLTTKFIKE